MTSEVIVAPEVAAVRPGEELDWAALEAYLRVHIEDLPAAPMAVLQFPRGSANLTYQLSFGERRLVLRRPPFGKTAPGAHDMGREHRILSRLWQAYPRAPRAYLLCEDISVIGAPFVVQDYRAGGVVLFSGASEGMESAPDAGLRIATALADALADLHAVDYAAIGLSELGKPEGFVRRQLTGWRDRWNRVAAADYAELMNRVGDRLERDMPATTRHSIVHCDYKLDNCQFRAGEPDTVVSVFDWDMATLGDPLIDVGITLSYWAHMSRGNTLGLPPKAVFADLYAARTGVGLEALRWYEAFANWRTAVAVQQLADRYQRGDSADSRLADSARQGAMLAQRAEAALNGET